MATKMSCDSVAKRPSTVDCQSIKAASNFYPSERYYLQAGKQQAASKSICQRRPQTRADRVMHSNASLSLLRASELRRSGMGCAAQCCVNGHQRHHTVQLQIDGELLAIMRRRSKKQEHPTRSLLAASRLPPATQLSVRGELIDATAARRCPTWT